LAGCSSLPPENQLDFKVVELRGDQESNAQEDETVPPVTESDSTVHFAVDRSAEIEIEDQIGNGELVFIEEIRVGRANSFLVIYDSTGTVLAANLVSPQSQPITVRLERPLTKSEKLEAVLYLDDGDGEFNLDKDSPLVDAENEIVHEDFDYKVAKNG
jgi:hypothetical protein